LISDKNPNFKITSINNGISNIHNDMLLPRLGNGLNTSGECMKANQRNIFDSNRGIYAIRG